MALKFYSDYWRRREQTSGQDRVALQRRIRSNAGIESGFGGADDPLGAQTPAVQDELISLLLKRGTRGGMDSGAVYDHIDAQLTYDENIQNVLDAGGQRLPSEERRDQREIVEEAESREKRRARDDIRALCRSVSIEAIEDIRSGFEPELPQGLDDALDVNAIESFLTDIEDAFGEDFVDSAIEACEIMFADELLEGREPPEPTPEPEPQETPSIAPEPEPEVVPEDTLVGRALSLMRE